MLLDRKARPLENLRLSVTDRCNLRCHYCMPEADYAWLERDSLLSFEELSALVDGFIELGVKKVRLTGGEPLLRRDLPDFVSMLARKPLHDLAMTTNGVLLSKYAQELKDAGLGRLTLSLDTLKPERFLSLTGQDAFERVICGLDSALALGFKRPKINCVLIKTIYNIIYHF